MQRALLQYYKPENREIIIEALKRAKRTDLIGNGPDCLVKGMTGQRPNTSAPSGTEKRRETETKASIITEVPGRMAKKRKK